MRRLRHGVRIYPASGCAADTDEAEAKGSGLEEGINSGGGFAAFGDGPHHQGLAAAHVNACGKDARDRGHVIRIGGDVAACIERFTPSCSIMPLRTGPRKPMAVMSTRSASMVNSLLRDRLEFWRAGPTRTGVQLRDAAIVAGKFLWWRCSSRECRLLRARLRCAVAWATWATEFVPSARRAV